MTKYDAYIFDVDGTLAIMHGRSPYDPTKYHTDLPNYPIIRIAQKLTRPYSAPHLIVVSGRDDTYKNVTLEWLRRYDIIPDDIHMRPANDRRKDQVIKEEIYRKKIEPFFTVLAVFDDRDRVVAMWREIGLTCLQVAPGNF